MATSPATPKTIVLGSSKSIRGRTLINISICHIIVSTSILEYFEHYTTFVNLKKNYYYLYHSFTDLTSDTVPVGGLVPELSPPTLSFKGSFGVTNLIAAMAIDPRV